MINFFSIRKLRFFFRDYWVALVTLAALCIITFLVFVSYKIYKESKNRLDILQSEVALLKNRSDTLRYNKTLTEDQITEYNKILTLLIPEAEDYFSIIYALETISQKTGFNIVSYSITLSRVTPEKLSIAIEGKGNLDSFLVFLQNYEFAGGRLITSEKIEFSGVNFTNTKVALNFYNKKFTFNEAVVPQLTNKEIERLEQIKKKIQISFKESDSDLSNDPGSYSKDENPF
ncbi:MAG: hypothetical protein WC489_05975 [Patescibacteria group bacterium]